MGNMKTKELPKLASPTIALIFKERLESMQESLGSHPTTGLQFGQSQQPGSSSADYSFAKVL